MLDEIVQYGFEKNNIWWGEVNQEIDSKVFDNLYNEVISYYSLNNSNFQKNVIIQANISGIRKLSCFEII